MFNVDNVSRMTKFYKHKILAGQIMRLQPGQCIEIEMREISEVAAPQGWTQMDWIMESVVGSSYEYTYEQATWNTVRFCRLDQPLPDDLRTYVSPDRQHNFKRRFDGLWEPV